MGFLIGVNVDLKAVHESQSESQNHQEKNSSGTNLVTKLLLSEKFQYIKMTTVGEG